MKLAEDLDVGMTDMRVEPTDWLTPSEEDPVVHRMLSGLPTPEPRRSLADRVLSHVRRPHPRSMRRIENVMRGLVDSGRIWLVIGGLAVGSLLPVAVGVIGITFLAPTLAGAVDAAVNDFLPLGWTFVRSEAMSLFETGLAWASGFELPHRAWLMIALGTLIGLAGCGWGLHRTMTPRAARR
jgi:hypothetical protein